MKEPASYGKPVTLTAVYWEGDPPQVGDWCGTQRGRTSYRIVGVTPRRPPAEGYRLQCVRCRRGQEGDDAAFTRWHMWTWAPRGR